MKNALREGGRVGFHVRKSDPRDPLTPIYTVALLHVPKVSSFALKHTITNIARHYEKTSHTCARHYRWDEAWSVLAGSPLIVVTFCRLVVSSA